MSASRSRRPRSKRPDNDASRLGLRAFIEAWGIVALLIVLLGLGVTVPAYLIKSQPAPTDADNADVERNAPRDVPVMPGAVLTRQTSSGRTSIYTYTVAQGSLASVQAYYRGQLERGDWVRQPRSNSSESEYIADDKKLVISLTYRGSHVQIRIIYTAPK